MVKRSIISMKNKIKILSVSIFATIIILGCRYGTYVNREILISIVKDVDRVDLYFYRSTDTLQTTLIDKERIAKIISLIDGKVEETVKQCKPSGHILYFKSNKMVFESFFTVDKTDGKECEQLSYFLSPQRYNTRLTYRAGMLIDYLSGLATKK